MNLYDVITLSPKMRCFTVPLSAFSLTAGLYDIAKLGIRLRLRVGILYVLCFVYSINIMFDFSLR